MFDVNRARSTIKAGVSTSNGPVATIAIQAEPSLVGLQFWALVGQRLAVTGKIVGDRPGRTGVGT